MIPGSEWNFHSFYKKKRIWHDGEKVCSSYECFLRIWTPYGNIFVIEHTGRDFSQMIRRNFLLRDSVIIFMGNRGW